MEGSKNSCTSPSMDKRFLSHRTSEVEMKNAKLDRQLVMSSEQWSNMRCGITAQWSGNVAYLESVSTNSSVVPDTWTRDQIAFKGGNDRARQAQEFGQIAWILILVSECADNGNLHQWLYGFSEQVSPLTWAIRMNIIRGRGKGLAYLHEDIEPKIIHQNLKSSHILLDHQWNPKINDFGITKLFNLPPSKELKRMLLLDRDIKHRPTMGDVIHMLEPRDLLLEDDRQNRIDGSSCRKTQRESRTVAKFGEGDFNTHEKERKITLHRKIMPAWKILLYLKDHG
ncbi:hypothetical protein DKX38_005757 [Salix brachista]|uniref:non-specific serine/threonine protein kinase n=1 Tax=Salix brachista TaxID=2182728 RepID=A0A5N5N043_9ROSI|nr:hypothetical protein DKX38_005757 [Salix brachista]